MKLEVFNKHFVLFCRMSHRLQTYVVAPIAWVKVMEFGNLGKGERNIKKGKGKSKVGKVKGEGKSQRYK
jgi:hypothetical protein